MELSFEKYQGIGNDFVVLRAPHPSMLSVAQAIALCDRHFGLGADGVLLVSPPETPGSRARMTVLNADGSRPEMCGNGLRCVALFLARESGENQAKFQVDTDAGPRACEVQAKGDTALVKTGLGKGSLEGHFQDRVLDESLDFDAVSMGNPHAICFRNPIKSAQLDELGPRISSRFAQGSNVEVASLVGPQALRVDVWERGVGRTLACGTGAAATAFAAAARGLVERARPITVQLPGGSVEIRISGENDVTLEGPAAWVFSGTTQMPTV